MSRVYIILLATASIWVAAIGAVFSISGLVKLFAGAPLAVGIMAAALEFSKLVTAGYLYRYWGHVGRLMRTYLCSAVVALSAITSLGIFGFLCNAYQKSSITLKHEQLRLDALNNDNTRIQDEIKRLQGLIAAVPATRITKRLALQDAYEPRIRNLQKQSDEIYKQIHNTTSEVADTQLEVGPLMYVAENLHTDVDVVAKLLILLFVSIFDPLAICLVFATNLAIRVREKYRGNEMRIASLSFVKPVDHRFKRHG